MNVNMKLLKILRSSSVKIYNNFINSMPNRQSSVNNFQTHQFKMLHSWRSNPPYKQPLISQSKDIKRKSESLSDAHSTSANVTAKYIASCQCAKVRYEVTDDPLDSKLCHCRDCQKLHGAPFEWVSIFRKTDVRFVSGMNLLYFWSDELGRGFEAEERDKYEREGKVQHGLGMLLQQIISTTHYFHPI